MTSKKSIFFDKLLGMSFLNKIFGNSVTPNPKDFWKPLENFEDLDKAILESNQRKVVIFKHSTRCFISKTVLRNFEKEVDDANLEVSYYFLDLLQHRDISNKVASDFNIEHQSPQIIVLKDGNAINNASHQHINQTKI